MAAEVPVHNPRQRRLCPGHREGGEGTAVTRESLGSGCRISGFCCGFCLQLVVRGTLAEHLASILLLGGTGLPGVELTAPARGAHTSQCHQQSVAAAGLPRRP